MQPIVRAKDGVIRFHPNAIIQHLFDTGALDLNIIATMGFSNEDHIQIAQLLGYSVSGFGDLSYVDRRAIRIADNRARRVK